MFMDKEAIAAHAPSARPEARTQTVMVVDDDPVILRLSQVILDHAHYGCVTVQQPERALTMLEDRTLAIDLLLADIVMPAMNGVALAQRAVALRPELQVL